MGTSTTLSFTDAKDKTSVSFVTRIPLLVFFIAVLASLIHIAPYWRAQSQVPPGWTFTGNLTVSPDLMQYRVWARQSQETGVLVTNKFTGEPNQPHLLVLFYYLVGKISALLDVPPEFVYAYAGSLFAFIFTVLLFVIVRQFLGPGNQVWWVFGVIMLGGGLGAVLRVLSNLALVRNAYILKRIIAEGLWSWPIFENYRGSYVVISLLDTHYLLFWLIVCLSVLSFYFALREFSLFRLALATSLFSLTTLIHLYDGITLLMISAGVMLLLWHRKLLTRSMVLTFAAGSIAIIGCLYWQAWLYAKSGLPMPPWRAKGIFLSTLLISYPVAWAIIGWGFNNFWKKANFNQVFVVGWALGCLCLTLSGPFYPYPDRGTLTLQIPLYIIAGIIYFSRNSRVKWTHVVITVMLLGITPAQLLDNWWENATFSPDKPFMFMSEDHREITDLLKQEASENDILIAEMPQDLSQRDIHWLAPEYPGTLYCAHFFLTVDFDKKCAQVNKFFNDAPEDKLRFLRDQNIRFVYVGAGKNLEPFEQVPDLILLQTTKAGSLFEYVRATSGGPG